MKNKPVLKHNPDNIYTLRRSFQTAPCSFLIFIFSFLIVLPLSAQDQEKLPEDLWFSPSGEIALYSPVSLSYGGGIAIAYGSGTSIGIKASWFFDFDGQVNVMELNVLFRLYFLGNSAISGPFIQFAGGPSIYFNSNENISFPARIGIPNAGLALGWRFLLGKYAFIEPSIRGGYPFIAGVSLSAGVHFWGSRNEERGSRNEEIGINNEELEINDEEGGINNE